MLRFETQLRNIDGTLSTIEMQREALESAANNTEVIKVMGVAAGAMKRAHNNLSVEDIEDIMDDIQEQQDTAKLITEAISNPVGFTEVMTLSFNLIVSFILLQLYMLFLNLISKMLLGLR